MTLPKTLFEMAQLNQEEWENLCDGCGICCMVKLEDEDSGKFHLTSIACDLLDTEKCRCQDYKNRQRLVSDCLKLTVESIPKFKWLPSTCAYRLLAEGKPLPHWHHLECGDREEVHRKGKSMKGKIDAKEKDIPFNELVNWIVT